MHVKRTGKKKGKKEGRFKGENKKLSASLVAAERGEDWNGPLQGCMPGQAYALLPLFSAQPWQWLLGAAALCAGWQQRQVEGGGWEAAALAAAGAGVVAEATWSEGP